MTSADAVVDDRDATLGVVRAVALASAVLLATFLPFATAFVFFTTPIVERDLEPRRLPLPALFFFAAADLFDDPGLEHGRPYSSLWSCNIRRT